MPPLALSDVGGPFGHVQRYKTGVSNEPDDEGGKSSFFAPPARNWGFDVGLLSQQPDLFSRQFATSFNDDPNEFFREVSRNDQWVDRLLCSKAVDINTTTPDIANVTVLGDAVSNNQRPGNCPN